MLADLPVELLGRLRSDRVLRGPRTLRAARATGRPPRHGPDFALSKPETWWTPAHITATDTARYGRAVATAWDGLYPRLTHRGVWAEHPGELPVVAGTLIRLQVLVERGGVVPPPIAREFPLSEAAEAHRFLESGAGFGKVVLRTSD